MGLKVMQSGAHSSTKVNKSGALARRRDTNPEMRGLQTNMQLRVMEREFLYNGSRLLANKLGIELRSVGSGNRMTFGPGEAKLSEWMAENASVVFHVCERPWETEGELIPSVCLPLNLDQNRNHHFHSRLSALRRAAKQRARQLEVLDMQANGF